MGKIGPNFTPVNSVILHQQGRTIMKKFYLSKLLFNLIKSYEIAKEQDKLVETEESPNLFRPRPFDALTDSMLDIDQVLKDCENYVNQYVTIVQNKEESADMNDFAEYSTLLANGRELAKNLKIAKSKNQLSPNQVKKLQQIQAKLAEAMEKKCN